MRFILLISLIFSNIVLADIHFVHSDIAGTPKAITNERGEVVSFEVYSPFGYKYNKEISDSEIGFKGSVYDNISNLNYMKARYYSSEISRFISLDPAGFTVDNPLSFNKYSFSNNNPYKYGDTSGNIVESVWDAANVAMGVASAANNFSQGNWADGAIDVGGVMLDSASMLLPGVPGGAATALTVYRGTAKELKRPYLRKSTRETILNSAKKTPDGKFIDPNDGKLIDPNNFHFGHKPGFEHWRLAEFGKHENMSQKQFNNFINNNPNFFQIEDPSNNMSGKFQLPDSIPSNFDTFRGFLNK